MKIFVLEDDARRRKELAKALAGHEVTWAEGVTEAKERWAGGYDLAFLDHDLGGETYVDSADPNTGYQFLKAKLEELGGTVVVVHSWNTPAAIRMEELAAPHAKAALRIPFGPPLLLLIQALLVALTDTVEVEAT